MSENETPVRVARYELTPQHAHDIEDKLLGIINWAELARRLGESRQQAINITASVVVQWVREGHLVIKGSTRVPTT